MKNILFPLRRIRSFVVRDGRMTESQRDALKKMWPQFGLEFEDGLLDFSRVFQREAPRILEIGFGSGYSLLEIAKAHPEQDFIGIEMHQPGIGSLLLGVERENLSNIRIFYHDAVEVLEHCVPNESLDTIQIFFPDPWPKRRHHKRRLIQPAFVNLIVSRLKKGGTLHLATDWEDYAKHMMKVLSAAETLKNLAGANEFSNRSAHRPVVTKFEQRGTNDGRQIWELQFVKLD